MASHGTQGGSHEQHVKAGQQSHKNSAAHGKDASSSAKNDQTVTQGGSHDQHSKAGQQSDKNKH
jgi:hypothetical protein